MSCFVNPGMRKISKFCYLAGQRLNYLTFTRGIFKVEREEERSTANSKVGGFVWLCCSLRNDIRGRSTCEVSKLQIFLARAFLIWAPRWVLRLRKTSKERDCKRVFFSLVWVCIICAVSQGKIFFISLFTQRGLFSKLVGSLRRNKRPNTGREDIELGSLERRRNRAYTSDARLNVAR